MGHPSVDDNSPVHDELTWSNKEINDWLAEEEALIDQVRMYYCLFIYEFMLATGVIFRY